MSAGSIGQQIINGTYGLDNKSPTAYEELKAWCEKHLEPDDYEVVPESLSYCTTIYFTESGTGYISFGRDGEVRGMGALDAEDEMYEHINEVEGEKKRASEIVTDPPLTSIGGMMVRKMIAEYERKQQ